MAAPQVVGASIAELADGVRARKWKARELVESYLDRIARLDGKLGCYLLVDADGARRRADQVDATVAAGRDPACLPACPLASKTSS